MPKLLRHCVMWVCKYKCEEDCSAFSYVARNEHHASHASCVNLVFQ